MASHWVLQYLLDVVLHEQMGRAHFSPFAAAIYLSPGFGSVVDDLKQHPNHWTKAFLSNKRHIVIVLSAGGRKTDFKLRALKTVAWIFTTDCPKWNSFLASAVR